MTGEVMRGATRARAYIEAHLRSSMPPLIIEARSQWNIPDWKLPLPAVYDAYDPLTASVYPIIGSLVSRTSGWRRNDYNEHGEEVYEATYAMRVFVWTITAVDPQGVWESPEYDSAMRMRDDLLGITRSAILSTPSLGMKGIARVNEGTLTEDYLDAIKLSKENSRWAAGGTLSFDMQVVESNFLPIIGEADTVSVDVDLLVP
jgi:hypothetical protein